MRKYEDTLFFNRVCFAFQTAYGSAFLPGYRLAFTKHATTRGGDAASINPDPTSMVWGYVYRVHDHDREELKKREGGYSEIPVTVYLISPAPEDDPTPLRALTFAATKECPQHCGPPAAYLDLIIEGAKERQLPEAYRQTITSLRKAGTG